MLERMAPEGLREQLSQWIADDPDPETRAELSEILAEGVDARLGACAAPPLGFGTAGLRALVGAGPARFNEATVRRLAHGLGSWLLARVPDARTLPVVVGHDARRHSARFARTVEGALRARGLPVRVVSTPAPTPLLVYAGKQLGASCTVVLTASHNPAAYHGCKLYGPDGVQLGAPADAELAAFVEGAPPAREIEIAPLGVAAEALSLEALFPRYLHELAAWRPETERATELEIVYTPVHGVAEPWTPRALAAAGYAQVERVAAQSELDPEFGGLASPNPELPEVLTAALELAQARGAELLLANDPDGDRLAVAAPSATGRWLRLSGDDVGLLLADHLLAVGPWHARRLVVSSVVSSPLLGELAAAHGARWERTLTGFKWIWRAGWTLEREQGQRFVLGYEEALGYSVGGTVRDKDGISAAVLVADIAAAAKQRGESLLDVLASLYRRHGLWVSAQRSVTLERPERLPSTLERLVASPPVRLGSRGVTRLVDYRQGAELRPAWLGVQALLELWLEGGGRVLLRPSGTEPTLKSYVHLPVSVPSEGSLWTAREVGQAAAAALAEEALSLVADAVGR